MEMVILKYYIFQLVRKSFSNLEKKECYEPSFVELVSEKNEAVGVQNANHTSELSSHSDRTRITDVEGQLQVFLENTIRAAVNFCLKGQF